MLTLGGDVFGMRVGEGGEHGLASEGARDSSAAAETAHRDSRGPGLRGWGSVRGCARAGEQHGGGDEQGDSDGGEDGTDSGKGTRHGEHRHGTGSGEDTEHKRREGWKTVGAGGRMHPAPGKNVDTQRGLPKTRQGNNRGQSSEIVAIEIRDTAR